MTGAKRIQGLAEKLDKQVEKLGYKREKDANTWDSKPHPFIKWAGNKTKILSKLGKYIPEEFEDYYEPFLGSGALFFHLVHTKKDSFKPYLSDSNEELINTFIVVRDNVEQLIALLKKHRDEYHRNPEKYYYAVREKHHLKDSIERAARMLFLNKTCYNGLYRVNKKNEFNVPFGTYEKPKICNEKELRNASKALQRSKAKISAVYYQLALEQAKENDFVYLDPPYQPVNATSSFTNYTHEGFSENDQKLLAKVFSVLTERGCKIVLSNSDTPLIHSLYSGFNIEQIKVSRTISCIGEKRKGSTELIICNFRP